MTYRYVPTDDAQELLAALEAHVGLAPYSRAVGVPVNDKQLVTIDERVTDPALRHGELTEAEARAAGYFDWPEIEG